MATGRICLVGVGASIAGLHWESTNQLRIGRQQNLEIVVNDPSVSKVHAEVRMTPRGWLVRDLGSTTGTLINGIPVEPTGRMLCKSDVLQCGALAFEASELEIQRPLAPPPNHVPKDIRATGTMLHIEALSHRTWEQGLRDTPSAASNEAGKRFLALLRAGSHLSRIDCLPEFLQALLDDTMAVLDAQRGTLLLADESTGVLTPHALAGPPSPVPLRYFSRSLAERCFVKGESVLCNDAALPAQTSAVHSGMTSIICGVLRSPRRRLGILHVSRGTMQSPFTEADFQLVEAIASIVAVGIESALAVDRQKNSMLEEAVAMVHHAIALRDPAAAARGLRMALVVGQLAAELNLSMVEQRTLQWAAKLHGIGVLARDAKAHATTPGSGATNSRQTQLEQGFAVIEKMAGLAAIIPVLRHCRESWDGTGFPLGLRGDSIPVLARVLGVAAALDKLTAGTDQQSALTPDAACKEVAKESGRQFDPSVVAALMQVEAKTMDAFRG